MTQEQKELLFKDLCARLPYRVKIAIPGLCDKKITFEPLNEIFKGNDKPYLFPMSSITDEQKREYAHILVMSSNLDYSQLLGMTVEDWLNKNHFDYLFKWD